MFRLWLRRLTTGQRSLCVKIDRLGNCLRKYFDSSCCIHACAIPVTNRAPTTTRRNPPQPVNNPYPSTRVYTLCGYGYGYFSMYPGVHPCSALAPISVSFVTYILTTSSSGPTLWRSTVSMCSPCYRHSAITLLSAPTRRRISSFGRWIFWVTISRLQAWRLTSPNVTRSWPGRHRVQQRMYVPFWVLSVMSLHSCPLWLSSLGSWTLSRPRTPTSSSPPGKPSMRRPFRASRHSSVAGRS